MIRIVRARTLTALRAEASQVPDLCSQVAELSDLVVAAKMVAGDAQVQAEAARKDARRARDAYDALEKDTIAKLADPGTRERVRGAIALVIIREEIARVRAKGNPDAVKRIRVVEAILGEHAGDDLQPRPDAAKSDREP